jgi:hypothetical protein
VRWFLFIFARCANNACSDKSGQSTGAPSQLSADKKNSMAVPPIRFSREYAIIVRTEGRASHPVFGETVLSAHFSGPAHRYFDRFERAGLLTSESSSGPAFPTLLGQWHFWGLRRPLQRRNRPGFTPGSLLSCGRNHRHSFKDRRSTIFCGPFQRTTQDVAFFA